MGDELENSYGLFQPALSRNGINTVDGGFLSFNNPTRTSTNNPTELSTFGKGIAGLQTLGNLMGAWNGYQQNKLAKQQFAFQQDAFNKQYAAQRALTNSQLEDRQRRRVRESANNMSVAEYMDRYGVK